ncbi:uncharacterized protein LTR77_002305 [Saxophila tyrrhenica]|uniref:Large ribosomal subunit protein bL34m n=1 Tax=Saxophila tyrrhenica TaxID=1690608 RepID=A0AAV9PI84_9PEZI|nr:hypothetical protein LTR77_002305 [Saxophila tyrrhenica]
MFCTRCLRSAFAAPIRTATSTLRQLPKPSPQASRPLSILSRLPTRPTLPTSSFSAPSTTLPGALPTSSTQPAPQQLALQVRTAIRDTYNPSHRIRKRRHGFLSRARTRTGRRTLKRRMAKKRSTLSH